MVHTSKAKKAEDRVSDVLEDYTKRWRLVEVLPGKEDNTFTLEYLLRLKRETDPAELAQALSKIGEPEVNAVELNSIKGMKKQKA